MARGGSKFQQEIQLVGDVLGELVNGRQSLRRSPVSRAIFGPGLNDINLLRRHFLPFRRALGLEGR
jgi:hypothetical protein